MQLYPKEETDPARALSIVVVVSLPREVEAAASSREPEAVRDRARRNMAAEARDAEGAALGALDAVLAGVGAHVEAAAGVAARQFAAVSCVRDMWAVAHLGAFPRDVAFGDADLAAEAEPTAQAIDAQATSRVAVRRRPDDDSSAPA